MKLDFKNMTQQEKEEWVKKEKVERHARMLDYWKARPPFKDIDDIPPIPRVPKEEYDAIIIPNIIRCGGIPKDKLEVGKTYIGNCRNAKEAVWGGNEFTYIRTKFGTAYTEVINHFQDDDGYDLFVPIKIKQF